MIMAGRQYPTYSFRSKWLEPNEDGKDYGFQIQDAPVGYHWNSSGFTTMFKSEPSKEQLAEVVKRHVDMLKGKYSIFGEPAVTFGKQESRTWCLGWFNHWTFDVGQTDREALESFEQYVRQHERFQGFGVVLPDNVPCLMGAEDRWRWKGVDDTPAPCRCDGCKGLGRIVINH